MVVQKNLVRPFVKKAINKKNICFLATKETEYMPQDEITVVCNLYNNGDFSEVTGVRISTPVYHSNEEWDYVDKDIIFTKLEREVLHRAGLL